MNKVTKPAVVVRRGDFAVDGGGNVYFKDDPEGDWAEIDVGEHSACAYVCMTFSDDKAATPHGARIVEVIEGWVE